MAAEPGSVEQAVARAVRDNLAQLQRLSEELQQSVADLVAACSSSRPTNALPPVLRAQASAASLAASLEVLARFIAASLQPIARGGVEWAAPATAGVPAVGSASAPTAADAGREMGAEGGPAPVGAPPREVRVRATPVVTAEAEVEAEAVAPPEEAEPARAPAFDIKSLASEEQELHRRANRVAKVSMQDIKMLRPEEVKQGRQNKDLCARLKADIEKARKEYDRRFRAILDHPVDYFYDWMVDILADGDPNALGEYPYRISGSRR
jgi:hypothetical protein